MYWSHPRFYVTECALSIRNTVRKWHFMLTWQPIYKRKQFVFCIYLGLVPGFSLFAALGCDLLVLSLDLGHNMIHVEVSGVVHLHNDGCVFNAGLQLTQFLIHRDEASLRVV